MEKEIRVKEMWWDNDDFHVISVDGVHTVFKGAYITDSSEEHIDPSLMKVEKMTFKLDLRG